MVNLTFLPEAMKRRSDIGAVGQQNKASERMEEQKDWKEQQNR